tara:strand:- start:1001 stop:2002 length:1002 start_codon:yes stop_codon:yes gene_type:complete
VSNKRKKVLITGGCGFIGSHVVEHFRRKTDWDIVVVDKLSYASNGFERLRDSDCLHSDRVKVMPVDFTLPFSSGLRKEIGDDVNIILHMGAESHVDNSIKNPRDCFKNNIDGTVEMLEYAKTLDNLEFFFYFSTDEVFGYAPDDTAYAEWDRHKPTNPYSASKSAAESICVAYENTYGLPLITVNSMNVFGQRQHPEKFIPKVMKNIVEGDKTFIHSYKDKKRAGSRFYIHARNVAAAVLFLFENGDIGDKYNIVGEKEVDNLTLALMIAEHMGQELNYEMVDFHSDRPGHDLRYALKDTKMAKKGWELPINFEESLKETVDWTMKNKQWLNF